MTARPLLLYLAFVYYWPLRFHLTTTIDAFQTQGSRSTIKTTTISRSMVIQSSAATGDTDSSSPTTTTTTTTTTVPIIIWNDFLAVAVKAAKRAGEIIVSHDKGVAIVNHKANSRDLLTIVDPQCEKIIKETIQEEFPGHQFLGEEDVEPGRMASAVALRNKLQKNIEMADDDSSRYLWIVDPIDGTTNFVHGMPLCMPSIALIDVITKEIIVGVIYDCHRDELFTAMKDKGAYRNGIPIQVGSQETLSEAVIAMGSPPAEESYQKSLLGIQYLMPKVRTIRMLGSAALMLAWVANGRLTAYWEYDLSSWDTAAGVLLIIEAGGTVTDLLGNPFTVETRQLCASNGKIHSELVVTLRDEAGIH